MVAVRVLQALRSLASGEPAAMAALASVCVLHVRRVLVAVNSTAHSSRGARAHWRAPQTCTAAASVSTSKQAANAHDR